MVFVRNADSRGFDFFPNTTATVPFNAQGSAQPIALPAIAVYLWMARDKYTKLLVRSSCPIR